MPTAPDQLLRELGLQEGIFKSPIVAWPTERSRFVAAHYLFGLTGGCYLYFLEGLLLGRLEPYGPLGVTLTLLAPLLYVVPRVLWARRGHRLRLAAPVPPIADEGWAALAAQLDRLRAKVQPEAIRSSLLRFLTKNQQPLVGLVLFLFWAGGYYLVGMLTEVRETHTLTVRLDRLIPLEPAFVWIYLSVYMTFIMPFLLIKDQRLFRLAALSDLVVILLCYAIFLIYPVIYHRPTFEVHDLSTWALALVYAGDPPINCFPSMHGAMAMMSALILFELDRRLGVLAILHTLAIGASTFLVKQHYVLDIFVGFLLSILVYHLFFEPRMAAVLRTNLDQLRTQLQQLEQVLTERVRGPIDARLRRLVVAWVEQELEQSVRELVRRVVREELDALRRTEEAGTRPEERGTRPEEREARNELPET